MNTQTDKKYLLKHKKNAISKLESYIESLISSNNPKLNKKAVKFSYWLEDYIKFLNYEKSFSPTSLKRYKRGEIIKVHLGYNIGSEEGGLHYAIVLDKENSIHSPVLTILPLTSLKPNRNINNLKKGEIYIGNEIYNKLNEKATKCYTYSNKKLEEVKAILSDLEKDNITSKKTLEEIVVKLTIELANLEKETELFKSMTNEIKKMKTGSIVLTNQITTISKIRIYNPKTNHDILSGIKLSADILDKIDNEIKNLFIK
ncbi:type II toxin-antitoxin system PemK/MazF family toxin [Velocimicrobium porci]|uniref:Type II toxin-antitoxin system PemK/MazF family toxin n=1 Tax=Velocimicrobium porci TaxID=2606634 RepID=A0A6L5Y0F6_9FIRM|nr:type II toxin-antitoxin system PemK/MazF family toxin [Velocimicrobium porci]MSS64616.1 type II toxin-antitoxin system PemK/MazF family toxin [Velocimicrobium porci]